MMKTFFDDLSKILGEKAETVSTKATEAVEIQKLKSQIRALEKGNDNDLIELGNMVYDKFKDGETLDEEVTAYCEAIQERENTIAEYEQKISAIKGDTACEVCGMEVAKGMKYCPYCGAKVEEPEEDPVEEADDADVITETIVEEETIVEPEVTVETEAAEEAADEETTEE